MPAIPSRVDLSVRVGPLELRNPVITASGTFGYGEEFASFADLGRLGAIVVKGLSLRPRDGNPPPRIVETRAGMINAIGLQNVGVAAFAREKMPFLRDLGTPVLVNFFGNTVEEYEACASELNRVEGVAALEVNVSCPNVKAGGIAFGTDPGLLGRVVEGVRRATGLPLIVKLSPNVADIRPLAEAAVAAGADILSLINTIPAMAVDLENRRPALANVTGGLSGPAIKPVALRLAWEVLQAVDVPVIGVGGIWDAQDALEFLCLGCRAVQVGTVNFVRPWAALEIADGIARYLGEKGYAGVGEFIGTFRVGP